LASLPIVKRRSESEIRLRNGIVITNVDPDISRAFDEVWIQRDYTPRHFHIGERDIVIDIGAHVGLFTLYASRKASHGQVFSYEPSSSTFALLQQNLRRNGARNVVAENVAVAGQNEERTLFVSIDHRMGSSLYEENITSESPLTPQPETVRCVTLNHIFNSNNIKICDFLKMDSERAEYEILRNARPSVLRQIRRIAMEYHVVDNDDNPEMLKRLLESQGFIVRYYPFTATNKRGMLFARRALS
jgi:FkbM family methyltransferase